jgi:hypothetical protein
VTPKEENTSNKCKSVKEEFEDMLSQEFKALEKDYDKLSVVLDKFNKRMELHD